MQKNNTMEILSYAKKNVTSFQKGGVSSNEIRFFDYDGKKYILKTALMVGDNLSPFWTMMKNVFLFTFEKQNEHLNDLYSVLKDNLHIPVATFVVADDEVMIYEYMEGVSWDEDEFPKGTDNAYKLICSLAFCPSACMPTQKAVCGWIWRTGSMSMSICSSILAVLLSCWYRTTSRPV